MDKNQGYEIIQTVMLENGRGFALGHDPAAPSPYVTWACYDDDKGQRQYEWGHYGSDRPLWNRTLRRGYRNTSAFTTSASSRPRLPAFTSITPPSAPWTLEHSPSRPATPRMRSSTTISVSRLKMDHFWRGGI